MKKISIIGSGIAGMSAAAVLASKGHDVTVFEKNDKPGGRINFFKKNGFCFEMGPSWYWMPDVFEDFYKEFGKTTSDFYELVRLDPSYKVIFPKDEQIDVPASFENLLDLFESYEPGSRKRLQKFIDHAQIKYEVGMNEFVWKPGLSLSEFFTKKVFSNVFKLQLFNSIANEIKKVTKNDKLRQILEFPVLFLGATPQDTPALYSLMNYADLKQGTWYPKGGMYEIANAFYSIAKEQGAKFKFNSEIESFEYKNKTISKVVCQTGKFSTDFVIANADYHHIDQNILDPKYSNYGAEYWDNRKMAPSSLLIFLGVDRKLENLEHHNLFFDADFNKHAHEIYKDPVWPSDPLFYVCCPSKTDESVSPKGKENLFILMPLAPDLDDSDSNVIENYFDVIIRRIEKQTGSSFKDDIIFKEYFSVKDFKSLYNSFKGNAYGLANTLMQTATLKPSIKNKKLTNLFYTGQLTVPGPGLPPSIISGQLVANEVLKHL